MHLNYEDALAMYMDQGCHMFTVGSVLKDPETREVGIVINIRMSLVQHDLRYLVFWESNKYTAFTGGDYIENLKNHKSMYIHYDCPSLTYNEIKQLIIAIDNNRIDQVKEILSSFKDGGDFADCETLLITENDG